MTRLLASTALALMVAGPLASQEATTGAGEAAGQDTTTVGVLFLPAQEPDVIYGSQLIGMDVYSSQTDYATEYGDDRPVPESARADWDSIGEVNDVLLTTEGDVRGVLLDIGGFLGMGEHTVALDMSKVHLLRDENQAPFLAVTSSREELEQAPEFQREDQTMAEGAANPNLEATEPVTGPGTAMTRPAFEREGYMTAEIDDLTAEQLEGATVYDANDENVGEIEQLVLSDDGKIETAVVDVGGFLGMGEHSVGMSFDELQVMTNADNTEVRVYIDATREELQQRPEHQ
jgi:sporulation protein YlmC with PRC-barrel domain